MARRAARRPGGVLNPLTGHVLPGSERRNVYCPAGCVHDWGWRPGGPADPHWAAPGWRVIRFIETFCRHTKDPWRGRRFVLLPFQIALILVLYGTVDARGRRVFQTAFIEWGRKNGKSELAAALVCYHLFADGVRGGEVYGAAHDQAQAGLIFAVVADMVELSPALNAKAKVIRSRHRIVHRTTGTFYYAIPSDEAGAHGFNASAVFFDEVHTQTTRELYDVLTTSSGTRNEPMTVGITTRGESAHSLAGQLADYSLKVARGTLVDSTWHSDIRRVPEGKDVDWRDESLWILANPALGDADQIAAGEAFRSIEELRSKVLQAEGQPALQAAVRRLYLNQDTGSAGSLFDMNLWDTPPDIRDMDDLLGEPCTAGLDLASTTDLAALVLVFVRPEDERFIDVVSVFFMPKDTIRDRSASDGVPYDVWADEGWIVATDGNQIDYAAIRSKFDELARAFDIDEVGFDRWGATQMTQELQDAGVTVTPIAQTITGLGPGTKELMTRVKARRVAHGDNPVLRWMAQNTKATFDSNENMKPDKRKSSGRIDGIVSLVMALDCAVRAASPSVYEDQGVDVV